MCSNKTSLRVWGIESRMMNTLMSESQLEHHFVVQRIIMKLYIRMIEAGLVY